MKLNCRISNLLFEVHSTKKIEVSAPFSHFSDQNEEADIFVQVSTEWNRIKECSTQKLLGEDRLHKFYTTGDQMICTLKEGKKGSATVTIYDERYNRFHCFINEQDFYPQPRDISWIFRALPLNDIFQHYGRQIFHAAAISWNGKGILFAAPPGTGKSTQAKLWEEYRKAEIICNDRTVISRDEKTDKWKIYSFPIDGSDPVRKNHESDLNAVILIRQGEKDSLIPATPAQKLALLMQQCVIETWSAKANDMALKAMMNLMEDIPVYYFSCTPTQKAVETLEQTFIKDGVIVK